ncbi:YadA C-terminal domain-containing protein [Vibrio maritimus]|uniref:YadA C-terminal domain-containing protein n=1 Tax=Vibrio maritimus TaxID=990268 RepID=UPI001F1786C7|nr:YadA C-terminal domain-containing protein [Vibrio maritimus]
MKKQTIAMALVAAITSGAALAEAEPQFIDGIINETIVNGTGFEIARESGIPGFDKYFDGNATPEQRAQGALEFAEAAEQNPELYDIANAITTKVGSDENGWGAGDHIAADLKGALSNTPSNDHQRAMGDVIRKHTTKEERDQAREALKDAPNQGDRTAAEGAEGNVDIIDADIKARDEQADRNTEGVDRNRSDIDKNAGNIDRNREIIEKNERDNLNQQREIDKNKEDIANNGKRIDDNKREADVDRARIDGKVDENRGDIDKNKTDISNNGDRIKSIEDEGKQAGEDLDRAHADQERDNQKAADEIGSNRNKIEDIQRTADKWDQQAQKDWQSAGRTIDSKFNSQQGQIDGNSNSIAQNREAIGQNSKRIDNLENAFKQQGEEMRERYDGVKASMHAITNARPVAYDVGEFAVGAGLGASGSKKAIAIGGAYRFNDQWSGSFTVNHETEGRHTKADTSAGVGAQFSFK